MIRPRSDWTSAPAGGDRQKPVAPILFVHYSDFAGEPLRTLASQRAAIRSMRDYHVKANGWDDIGYSFVIAQPWHRRGAARCWVARGADRVPASQQGYNRGNVSVCVLAGPGEFAMARTAGRIADLARHVNARKVLGHRDVNSTDCPGDALYARLPEIRRLARL